MRLNELFTQEPGRLAAMSGDVAGIHFDFSKSLVDLGALGEAAASPAAQRLAERRASLFAGREVNPTEGRAATHPAERGSGGAADNAEAARNHALVRRLVDDVHAGRFGEIRHVIHLGIGGSALGPKLLIEALAPMGGRLDVAVVSNIDGSALAPVLTRFDPRATLVLAASKTFTTIETLTNLASVHAWMAAADVADPFARTVALTAAPEKARSAGVGENSILPFAETVGGRYSLWSSIGAPLALATGNAALDELRDGAAEMDRHFATAEPLANMPLLAALIDRHYVTAHGAQTRAVFAYDERLASLPAYLQQLEMESNGKSATYAGAPLAGPSGPVIWGGTGTDAQHAVFQLLHQGTVFVPVEFIAAIHADHGLAADHHRQLVANCLAQSAALMAGRPAAEGDAPRDFAGNRPSATILLERLTPRTLGALIAFYEHRTFSYAALCDINPFDQWGVELGKVMARQIVEGGLADPDPSTRSLLARAGLA